MNKLDIRTLKIADLNPAKYNPRKKLKPGDKEYEKLKKSIENFGYVELIVVNIANNNTVVSGHQRLSVLKDLGVEEVECVVTSVTQGRKGKQTVEAVYTDESGNQITASVIRNQSTYVGEKFTGFKDWRWVARYKPPLYGVERKAHARGNALCLA